MKQTLLRYESEQLAKTVKQYAQLHHQSINHTLNQILAHFFGVSDQKSANIYSDLDSFFGSWTDSEAELFEKNTAHFKKIDKTFWRASK